MNFTVVHFAVFRYAANFLQIASQAMFEIRTGLKLRKSLGCLKSSTLWPLNTEAHVTLHLFFRCFRHFVRSSITRECNTKLPELLEQL